MNERWKMISPIRKFSGPCHRPKNDDSFGYDADRRVLCRHQQPRTRFPRCQMVAEVIQHRTAIMRDQHAIFKRGAVQEFGIAEAIQASLLRRGEVDDWLLPPNGLYDCVLKIVVCLEANAQERGSPDLA